MCLLNTNFMQKSEKVTNNSCENRLQTDGQTEIPAKKFKA